MQKREVKFKILKLSYKGKGRPKKSDYDFVVMKDVPDFHIFDMLENATFKTSDTL